MPKAAPIITELPPDPPPEETSAVSPPVATGNGETEASAVSKYGDEPGFILNPPVEYQGRTIEFISIDLSKLKGSDVKAIGREFKARFKPDPNEAYFLDNQYLVMLFGRINDLDEGFFDRLNGVTYLQLTEFYKIRMKKVLGE